MTIFQPTQFTVVFLALSTSTADTRRLPPMPRDDLVLLLLWHRLVLAALRATHVYHPSDV